MARDRLWDEMKRMREEINKVFRRFTDETFLLGKGGLSNYRRALTDTWETDKEIIANIELPGVDKKDINLEVRDDGVEVKVEKKSEYEVKNKKEYRSERSYSGFYRYFSVPPYSDTSRLKASYNNGILEIRIPKNSKKKGKRIQID